MLCDMDCDIACDMPCDTGRAGSELLDVDVTTGDSCDVDEGLDPIWNMTAQTYFEKLYIDHLDEHCWILNWPMRKLITLQEFNIQW